MPRKKRKLPVHYIAVGFRDGAVSACFPERKPTARQLKEYGERIDADMVFREYFYRANEPSRWELDQRVRLSNTLANRLNTRRAIRELVLPELEAIHNLLQDISDRLRRIEQARND